MHWNAQATATAEIMSRQHIGHLTAPGIFHVKSESDTVSVPEDTEIASRQHIGHLTAPGIFHVRSESDTVSVPE
jgi:hypothetical protein